MKVELVDLIENCFSNKYIIEREYNGELSGSMGCELFICNGGDRYVVVTNSGNIFRGSADEAMVTLKPEESIKLNVCDPTYLDRLQVLIKEHLDD